MSSRERKFCTQAAFEYNFALAKALIGTISLSAMAWHCPFRTGRLHKFPNDVAYIKMRLAITKVKPTFATIFKTVTHCPAALKRRYRKKKNTCRLPKPSENPGAMPWLFCAKLPPVSIFPADNNTRKVAHMEKIRKNSRC